MLKALTELNDLSVLIRIAMSALYGGLLGFERQKSRHPIGVRTFGIVCVASCLAMITGEYISEEYNADAARIAAQVISGMGFLGAGTILWHDKNKVEGLTTAAGLWACACIGIACGSGYYMASTFAFLCIFLFACGSPSRIRRTYFKEQGKRQNNIAKKESEGSEITNGTKNDNGDD